MSVGSGIGAVEAVGAKGAVGVVGVPARKCSNSDSSVSLASSAIASSADSIDGDPEATFGGHVHSFWYPHVAQKGSAEADVADVDAIRGPMGIALAEKAGSAPEEASGDDTTGAGAPVARSRATAADCAEESSRWRARNSSRSRLKRRTESSRIAASRRRSASRVARSRACRSLIRRTMRASQISGYGWLR